MSIVERALQKAQTRKKAESSLTGAGPHQVELNPGIEGDAIASSNEAIEAVGVSPTSFESRVDGSPESRQTNAVVRLDIPGLRAEGRLPSLDRSIRADEEIRRVKWPLLKAVVGGDGIERARNNVIQVTSALAGEGKTFTALCLALSIVRDREMRVILVDGDVARPSLTPSLGLATQPGFLDALREKDRDVSSIMYPTDVEGLFFVPAGRWHSHAPEFLAGSRMPEVMAALSEGVGRGVIVLDSPPLLATNEAQVMAKYAGQVLLVVRANMTEQQAVLDAVALVDKSALVRAVLNQVEPTALSRYYGHYYYSGTNSYQNLRDMAERAD